MSCWHYRRTLTLDNEEHVVLHCPEFAEARKCLMEKLHHHTVVRMQSVSDTHQLLGLLGSAIPSDWQALGVFMAR
eukprot:4346710-Karenia_brevis.AAC.1